jgi:hypothetical protein
MKMWLSVLGVVMALAGAAHADTAVQQVGFANGDDWEPAIAVDGQNVYVAWPHIGAATQTDSSGATCKTKQTSSYMYFQRSTDGGTTWQPYIIPRCPVSGTQIDAQVVVGPNHRVYVSYMDGPQANSNIEVTYSDNNGVTWSTPVNAAGSGGGDKDIMLVDSSGGVLVSYEHLSHQYVSYSPNPATTAFTQTRLSPPAQALSGTSLSTGGARDTKGNAYYVWTDATGNAKGDSFLWLSRSSNNYATFTTSMIDRSKAASSTTGAGWDYWGASVQVGVIAKATGNDRVVVIYNAGAVASGAQRIYTKYSDDLGVTWNIAYSDTIYPNGNELSSASQGAWHGFPSIAGTTAGVKVLWQDNRVSPGCTSSTQPGQCGLWNNYTRSSADGATWTSEVKTVLPLTHSYQVATPAPGGFYHPYGDYTWTATDGTHTWAVFGEGTSYVGPGTIYVATF